LKLAILSSPRTGNTWLRYLLADLFNLEQIAIHSPACIEWENLPHNVALQLHWHPTKDLVGLLRVNDFQPITLVRHPLDVLISILHFAPHESQTKHWLAGEGGNEDSIIGKAPTSSSFVEYCCSERATALLSVSANWLEVPGVIRVNYEDLVNSTEAALGTLISKIGLPANRVESVIQARSIDSNRIGTTNQHFWKGQPDFWTQLLTSSISSKIEAYHQHLLASLGYDCVGNHSLTLEQAKENWNLNL
jgi:hypothetical protein